METNKHFVAINNETGERIEFGIEDVYSIHKIHYLETVSEPLYSSSVCIKTYGFRDCETRFLKEFLEPHTLYYLHQGKYYNYETQEEMRK